VASRVVLSSIQLVSTNVTPCSVVVTCRYLGKLPALMLVTSGKEISEITEGPGALIPKADKL
jgi:hypothetical protein